MTGRVGGYAWRQVTLLVLACGMLGAGVGLLLTASLGSDGYSTMVNGISLSTGISFMAANLMVSTVFVVLAWVRRLPPGLGTVVQVIVVGLAVSVVLSLTDTPDSLLARVALMLASLPVVAVGIAGYLGSQTGAGPVEAFALAWEPPFPFKWSYSLVQGGGAVVGWLLGAAIGPATLAVIFLLGPAVDLSARLFRLETDQARIPR